MSNGKIIQQTRQQDAVWFLFIVVLVVWMLSKGECSPATTTDPASVAAVGYMTDIEAAVPLDIRAGLRDLNDKHSIRAELVTPGNVPDAYEDAMSKAMDHGLPCLCVIYDDESVKCFPDAKTR